MISLLPAVKIARTAPKNPEKKQKNLPRRFSGTQNVHLGIIYYLQKRKSNCFSEERRISVLKKGKKYAEKDNCPVPPS